MDIKFELDQQTINDLEIFGDRKSGHSIFRFYNQTKTTGGKNYLLDLMAHPITDKQELDSRVALIKFIASQRFDLEIDASQLDFIERYLRLNIPPLVNNPVTAFIQGLSDWLNPSNDYYLIRTSIQKLSLLFIHLKKKFSDLKKDALPEHLEVFIANLEQLVNNEDLAEMENRNTISFSTISKLDFMLRQKYKNELQTFVDTIYILDAYISLGKVANEKDLAFPEYVESGLPEVSIKNLFHPLLPKAVPYGVEITAANNLFFLTGPNMAGKSTFLKSMGLAIYIAHLGFPVPASAMKTTLYHGLITTINLSDNINMGYSHFYGEVKRVKETALKLKDKNKLFVIFDELFRGTNVKDAYDASLLIITSFAKINKSTFYISTHITEIAEQLDNNAAIQFQYFDFELQGEKPVYNYQLKEGISHERLGMHIVKNENIVEILNSIANT